MRPLKFWLSLLFAFPVCLSCSSTLTAGEADVSRLLPESTVAYLEISNPTEILATVLDHPLNQHVQGMDVYKQATRTEQYRGFLTGRKFFEIQIGTEWRPAVEALTAGGIYVGFDAASQGAVLLVRAKDEATMENFRVRILELTRLNGGKSAPEDYRDVPVYRIEKNGGAVVGEWFVISNKPELGKRVLDGLLDGKVEENTAEAPGTLFANADFRSARASRNEDAQAWAFGNLQAVRDVRAGNKIFEGRAENPLVELLVGGIQSTLKHSPYVTSSLTVATSGLKLQFASPWQADWVPEERSYFFGPDNSGEAPVLPEVSETLLTFATYRDVSEMWLRAGDLFDEQMNDKLAEADSSLSTIFAGKDFAEEILGAFEPQMGLIVTRQDFDDVMPVPAIKLPAFALVMELREPETMRAELRRTFQSAVGFFNIVGAQNGNPQLEMDMQKEGDIDLITSRYLPEKKERDSTSARIIFNFSPSVGFSGSRFVLASTATLAQQLSAAPASEAGTGVNTGMALNAPVIGDALSDNREQLISQNMLSEGHSREEAEAAIDLLFEIVRGFKGAGLNLDREGDQLELTLSLDVNERP